LTASTVLCGFVDSLKLSDIPPAAREHAKLLVLDTLGIALAGIDEPASRAARAVARLAGSVEQATLLVHGHRVPVAAAALANGTAAFSHNFTDTTLSCVIPGGPVAVPAALAVGEMTNASGADVLTAIVAGYEVMTRVGNAINAGPPAWRITARVFIPPRRAASSAPPRSPPSCSVSPRT
jgi:aconitate decarboxylase